MNEKKRLDVFLQNKYGKSRTYVQEQIKRGKVTVNGTVIKKPGAACFDTDEIIMDIEASEFVSRAGLKLEQALNHFNIDVQGLQVLDAGISTGGFTDCLLQKGAQHVYGVDVGTGQLHEKIAQDQRVTAYEQMDIRDCVDKIPVVDMVTMDISFISVLKVMHVVAQVLHDGGKFVVLIKPQFETHKPSLSKGGALKHDQMREKLVEKVVAGITGHGFVLQDIIECKTPGKEGSIEYLAYFIKGEGGEEALKDFTL